MEVFKVIYEVVYEVVCVVDGIEQRCVEHAERLKAVEVEVRMLLDKQCDIIKRLDEINLLLNKHVTEHCAEKAACQPYVDAKKAIIMIIVSNIIGLLTGGAWKWITN